MLSRVQARYREQASGMTLADGLEEYYVLNTGIVRRPDDLPAESRDLFRSHDLCHVIFGLTTSLADETLADLRTVLCTDVGLRRYLRYLRDPEARKLFASLSFRDIVGGMAAAAPRIPRALLQRTQITRPWPWRPPDAFLQRTLADLRGEFGIRVI
ncbi:MAG TPA: hypothetical protein VG248_15005 [Caulobacteraceae bacterium]|jgi:hypothetical protein|nr:hypothetical protein [Caulobacteraceae bacterium]